MKTNFNLCAGSIYSVEEFTEILDAVFISFLVFARKNW